MRAPHLLASLEPLTRTVDVVAKPTSEPELVFPHMALSHNLRLSGADALHLLAALAVCLDTHGARLEHLTCRRTGEASVLTCRISGLSSEAAHAVTQQLGARPGVHSINLEHMLSKGAST